ncbi:MAG: hypothetical protein L3K03_06880, partial [Thermoplasmata archaeon]|nr:hypothetical protein [Thermoplasmata archaeon]
SPARVVSLITGRGVRVSDRRLVPLLHGPVDADRIDYLQRDAHYTGVAHGVIDAERLLDTMEWSSRGPVFAAKGRSAVEGFLMGRTLMYSSVYYHKAVRAAEVMIASAVERDPGFPESARPLFGLTDGELLAVLRRRDGLARSTVERLEARELFKLAGGWREIPTGALGGIRRIQTDPRARRRAEAELARSLDAPDGAVLLDVVAGGPRAPDARDLDAIGIRDGRAVRYPFRGDRAWRSILLRPSTPWSVAVYSDPAWAPAAARRLPEALLRAVESTALS